MRNVTEIRNALGECPVWSARDQKLYWMDLLEPALYAYCPETEAVQSWPTPEYLGGLAVRASGGLIMGMQKRVVWFDPATGAKEDLAVFTKVPRALRFNDGKCDRRGRFFIGNLKDPQLPEAPHKTEKDKFGAGAVFVLETDLTFRVMETGFTTPNGFVWSPDSRTMYLADSDQNTIFAYDYDLEAGTFGNKRPFICTHDEAGVPDGACMDAEGYIWSARHEGGRIVRYRPDGSVDRSVDLPMHKPTSVAFGGKNLEILFVTSSSQGMSPQEIVDKPMSGTLLALDVGVRGMEEPAFGG